MEASRHVRGECAGSVQNFGNTYTAPFTNTFRVDGTTVVATRSTGSIAYHGSRTDSFRIPRTGCFIQLKLSVDSGNVVTERLESNNTTWMVGQATNPCSIAPKYTIKAETFRAADESSYNLGSDEPFWNFSSLGTAGTARTTQTKVFSGVDTGETHAFASTEGCLWRNCGVGDYAPNGVGMSVQLWEKDQGDMSANQAKAAEYFGYAGVIASEAGAPPWVTKATRPGLRKRVVIIGAGMAGLVAGFELARQGHEPVILEAQNRVGGRIYTLRTFAPGLYAEAGAMRIPRVHQLTLEYCHLFGLQLRPFVMDNPKAPVYLAGRRMTLEQLDHDPSLIPFELASHERGRTYAELWAEATREVRDLYEQKGEAAHTILGRLYDQYSIRDFLKQQGFSEGAVEPFGVLSYREANLGASVVEQLREVLGLAFEDMQEIAGGMDLLPNAFYQRLRRHVRLGAQVVAVDQNADHVTVHYKTASGTYTESGDYCICTVPFGVLRHLDFVPHLSKGKYRAIRSLSYNPSTKILLQVRHRFWEQHHGTGGATPTDLPIRRIVYPSHAPADEERGVLLASYTWGQDAARWGALGPA